jgi:hypothetical protein
MYAENTSLDVLIGEMINVANSSTVRIDIRHRGAALGSSRLLQPLFLTQQPPD